MTRGTFLKALMLSGGLALAGLAGGCSSTSTADAPVAVMSAKGDVVWVRDNRTGGRIVTTKAAGAAVCPECEKMATSYLNGDKTALKTCKTCGGSPTTAMFMGGRGVN